MSRITQIGAGLLLLTAALGAQPPNGSAPAPAGSEKRAPRLGNPGDIVQRLLQMTPEERESFLQKLPPERQARIRQRLAAFESLPQAERERRLKLAQMFASLPPETQSLVRRRIREFNQLPPDRRRLVGAAFQRLRRLRRELREDRLSNPQFQARFTPEEQQIIADLSEFLPPVAALGEVP